MGLFSKKDKNKEQAPKGGASSDASALHKSSRSSEATPGKLRRATPLPKGEESKSEDTDWRSSFACADGDRQTAPTSPSAGASWGVRLLWRREAYWAEGVLCGVLRYLSPATCLRHIVQHADIYFGADVVRSCTIRA